MKTKIIKLIEKRIKELIKTRNTSTTGGTKGKYNFIIGDLQNLIIEVKNLK